MFVAVVVRMSFTQKPEKNIFFPSWQKHFYINPEFLFLLYMNAFSLIESEASWERKEIILQNIYPSFSSRKPF